MSNTQSPKNGLREFIASLARSTGVLGYQLIKLLSCTVLSCHSHMLHFLFTKSFMSQSP